MIKLAGEPETLEAAAFRLASYGEQVTVEDASYWHAEQTENYAVTDVYTHWSDAKLLPLMVWSLLDAEQFIKESK